MKFTDLKIAKLLPTNTRKEIYECVQIVCHNYQNGNRKGDSFAAFSIPPRYGKSDLIRLSALELFHQKLAPTSICLCPWEDLIDQLLDAKKIQDMRERYGISESIIFSKKRIHAMQTREWWKLERGLPILFCSTIHLAQNISNREQFLDGIEDLHDRYKRAIPLFVDECHFVKRGEAWGKLIAEARNRGAYVVCATGTPTKGMPGFEENPNGEWNDATKFLRQKRVVNGETQHIKQTYEGRGRDIKIDADMEVTWNTAWNAKPPAMEHANACWVDVPVIDKNKKNLGLLSEQSEATLVGHLRHVMESKEMIDGLVDTAMNCFIIRRKKEKNKTQILFITGSDDYENNKDVNVQAQKFMRSVTSWLARHKIDNRQFKMEIATSVNSDGEPNEHAKKQIKDFRTGLITILFVKAMGIVGMDADSCKIVTIGNTLRNGPMLKQAFTRALTIWEDCCGAADLILPKDTRMLTAFAKIIAEQGGERQTEFELVNEEEVPPPEPIDDWNYGKAIVNKYSDTKGNTIDGDLEPVLFAIKRKYHTGNLTNVEILENYKKSGYDINEQEKREAKQEQIELENEDFDYGLKEVKGTFGREAEAIVSKYAKYASYGAEHDKWVNLVRKIKSRAKELCGVPRKIKVDKIDDVQLLEKLKNALKTAEKEIFGT